MDFIGEILSDPDPPGIVNQRWIELIREHPNLEPVPPRQGINPFTKKPFVYRPRPDVARVVLGGKYVGLMSWAEDGSNRVVVVGEPPVVAPLARGIAKTLGGRLVEGGIE